MSGPKIVVIGAGSFTFGYGLLADAIVDHRLDGAQMWMVDLDAEVAAAMAGIGRRMARECGVKMEFASTEDRREALAGADFVTTSIAVELKRRQEMDWGIAGRHGILQTKGECGSIGGLSYTLRSVPLVLSVCRDMEELCPRATLLNVTNPLTRVTLAATRYSSIRTVGFCYVALVGWRWAAAALGKDISDIDVTLAGLNHFSWLLAVRDKRTGEDLYPRLRSAVDSFDLPPLTRKYFRETGYLPASGEDHFGEYIPFDDVFGTPAPEFGHGTHEERAARRLELIRIAGGEGDWRALHHSWERPMDYVNAVVRDKRTHFDFLNVPNCGAIDGPAGDMIVEVPADVDADGARPAQIGSLPEAIERLVKPAAEASHWAVEAAVHADLKAAHKAIDADPAISDKSAARAALGEMLEAHKDILTNWRR